MAAPPTRVQRTPAGASISAGATVTCGCELFVAGTNRRGRHIAIVGIHQRLVAPGNRQRIRQAAPGNAGLLDKSDPGRKTAINVAPPQGCVQRPPVHRPSRPASHNPLPAQNTRHPPLQPVQRCIGPNRFNVCQESPLATCECRRRNRRPWTRPPLLPRHPARSAAPPPAGPSCPAARPTTPESTPAPRSR
jgi:hypothetical protein